MKAPRRLSLATTMAVLVLFVIYFAANRSRFRPLLDVNFWLLILIAALDIVLIFSNGLFTKFILRPFKKHIPVLESFYVSLISTVGNFFAPVGAGFGFRAVYLKKRHGLAYSHYISTLAGNYIIVFFVNSLAGLLSLFLLRGKTSGQYGVLVAAFAAVFCLGLFLSFVKAPKIKWGINKSGFIGRATRNLHIVTQGWNHIVAHKKLMLQLLSLTAFNLLLTMLITLTIIKSLHFSIGFAPLLLFSVLGSLSLFINITPANLGVKEAIYLFSSSVLGYSVNQILSIALIDRGVMFSVLAILWAVSHKIKIPLGEQAK